MMKTLKTSVLASGFWRLEAPRWHLGALWVSDVRGGKVFRIDLDGKITIVADVPSRPFGLGFLPDGDSLVASMTQRLILRFGAEKPTIHADLTEVASGYLRDLAVARDGNAYVTSFDADASGPDGFASARVLLATPEAMSDRLPTTSRIRTDWQSQLRMTYWLRKRSGIGFSGSRSTATEHCCIERSSQTSRG